MAFSLGALAIGVFSYVASATAPLFHVEASSLYEAGRGHGKVAMHLIQGFLAVSELTDLARFTFETAQGQAAFSALKATNAETFPEYVDEMRGIAEGAEVSLDQVWMINLLQELENLMPEESRVGEEHCTDIMAVSASNDLAPVHGHNEDWSSDVLPYVYFVAYHKKEGTEMAQTAGLCYPGMIIGNAITFNDHGLYYTQNAMVPRTSRSDGLAMNFVQRRALDRADTLRQLEDELRLPGQALGFNLNVVSIWERKGADLEVYENQSSLVPLDTNLSHMNMYKHIEGISKFQDQDPSTLHRQAKVDMLPAPKSVGDVMAILGNTDDDEYPIYRTSTMVSVVLDSGSATLYGWSGVNPSLHAPMWKWDLMSFFHQI